MIGLTANGVLYVGYLLLTEHGVGHIMAMTAVFAVGVAFSYIMNRALTFRHRGAVRKSGLRYIVVYSSAYIGNVATLFALVDVAHLPHRVVMIALIVLTACTTFATQKLWVFSDPKSAASNALRTHT